MNIIIAPHPDDEVIGNFSLIKRGLISGIIYVKADVVRLEYAKRLCKDFHFFLDTAELKDLHNVIEANLQHTYLVPDETDYHPLHKAVNLIGRMSGCRLGYYTTNMIASFVKELSIEDMKEKREILNKYYPDQKSLWENDWKYFLFEGVVCDFFASPTPL